MAKILPKRIYIYWQEPENDDAFLSAQESIEGIEDGTKVGIYQLVEIKTKVIREDLK